MDGKKSISWVRQLSAQQLEGLKVFVASWPFVKDHHGEFVFSRLDYCKNCFELWIDERGLQYRSTIDTLMTRMSEFIEGWEAACKAYNIKEEYLKDPLLKGEQ